MTEACDVCQAVGTMTPLVEVGLVGVGPVWIHQCSGCGFRQVRPRLDEARLGSLYSADYFDPNASQGFSGYARQYQRYERDAFFLAKELRAKSHSGCLLEVGSALGFFLGALSQTTAWQIEGVEVSSFGAWYARDRFGVMVHQTTLEDACLPSDAFDYVLQKDLLEHVIEPRRHLGETWRIMRPGAQMRLITPNGEADIRPLQHKPTSRSSVPVLGQGHLSFFSRRQLLRVLEDTGFRVLRFRNIGIRRGIRALGLIPGWTRGSALTRRETLTRPLASSDVRTAPAVDIDYKIRGARIDAEIAQSYRRLRGWRPYYYYRYLMKCLDTLPASMTIGQDFDVVVEKV